MEDQEHLLRCPENSGRTHGWMNFWKSALSNTDIHPLWHCLVEEGIELWSDLPGITYLPDLSNCPPHLRKPLAKAVQSRNVIGWQAKRLTWFPEH